MRHRLDETDYSSLVTRCLNVAMHAHAQVRSSSLWAGLACVGRVGGNSLFVAFIDSESVILAQGTATLNFLALGIKSLPYLHPRPYWLSRDSVGVVADGAEIIVPCPDPTHGDRVWGRD